MIHQGNRDLETTREKLRLLQKYHDSRLEEPVKMTHARELSLQSLKRMIIQLTEKIARYEAHASGAK